MQWRRHTEGLQGIGTGLFFKFGDRYMDALLLLLSIKLTMNRLCGVFYNKQFLGTTLIPTLQDTTYDKAEKM